MKSIGDTLAVLVGENYVNRFGMDGRSTDVIPQTPREQRLTAEALSRYFVKSASGQPVPLANLVQLSTSVGPEQAHAVQPAQRRHLPGHSDARRAPWATRWPS